MNNIDISIIFVNYNCANLLIDAIKSVKSNTLQVSYEIIVVDNASANQDIKKIKNQFPEDVTIIESQENIGFGRANNLAIPYASGDYLLFLNPDTLLLNDAISTLYAAIKKNPSEWGAVGGLLFDEQNKPNHSFGLFPSPWNIIRVYTKQAIEHDISFSENTSVDFVSGADLMIPRHIIDLVGGFDKDFFMYCEEADLQKRIAEKGYKRVIIPQARILHLEGGSYEKCSNRSAIRRYQQDKSYCVYVKKHHSKWCYWMFRFSFLLLRMPAVINPNYSFKDNMSYLKLLLTP